MLSTWPWPVVRSLHLNPRLYFQMTTIHIGDRQKLPTTWLATHTCKMSFHATASRKKTFLTKTFVKPSKKK